MNDAKSASARRRGLRILLWLTLLGIAIGWASSTLRISGDLRLFMPAPRSGDQRLLMQQLGEGPGSRLLLIALNTGASADAPDALAERSRALREALQDAPELAWISNGDDAIEGVPEDLQDYRYLLSSGPVSGSLHMPQLRASLEQRLQDLASPAAALVAPLIGSDPTLETLRLLESWTPTREPDRHEGVWLSADRQSALLLAQTQAAGFDPQGQQAALVRIREAFAESAEQVVGADESAIELEISGPGAFAERMATQTRADATRFGSIAGVALLVLMMLAYRSVQLPLLAALPLASGVIAGVAVTAGVFGDVHGITLAFGFTLLGVAQDYPVHLLSHRKPGETAHASARAIWPTLATGAGSSCLAYLIFLFAGVDALQQLAVFTVAGLGVAALTTRFALPGVLPDAARDAASDRLPRWMQQALLRRQVWRWPAWLLAVACAVVFTTSSAPLWNDDLGALTPVPSELLQRDRTLRSELGAPDVRWLLVLRASRVEEVLQRSEALRPSIERLMSEGVLGSADFAARYLPSEATQLARRSQLPSADELSEQLTQAMLGLPFKPNAFDGFLAAVDRARQLPPLTPADLAETPLALRVESLLQHDSSADESARAVGLFTLTDIQQPEILAKWAAAQPAITLLDLKGTAQSLATAWRVRVLAAMGVAALLLTAVVRLSLGSWQRAWRVLWPVFLGTACVLAVLHLLSISLTLFHLVSLVLAAGLGVDYALFFERAGADAAAQRRTLHALLVCAASTLLVFALLALSPIPVLRAIGVTVSLGVLSHVLLSLWLATTPTSNEATT